MNPEKSFYLDDMNLKVGSFVVCKCDMLDSGFTPFRIYKVLPKGRLRNDFGLEVIPSARFRKV